MPFTPFHFGAGLGAKGVSAPIFSWSAFCAAQVLIDCESLYHIVRRDYPVHRFFHTFVGAGLAGIIVSAAMLLVLRILNRPGSILDRDRWRRQPALAGEISTTGVWVGGMLGGLSHPLLDGLMHRDVRPFLPWSDANPFLGLMSVGELHLLCLAAAALGAVGVALWMRPKKAAA
jgi:hypothetical protein